jgi:hypothetical protein
MPDRVRHDGRIVDLEFLKLDTINILVITDLGELQFQYVRGCNDALC